MAEMVQTVEALNDAAIALAEKAKDAAAVAHRTSVRLRSGSTCQRRARRQCRVQLLLGLGG